MRKFPGRGIICLTIACIAAGAVLLSLSRKRYADALIYSVWRTNDSVRATTANWVPIPKTLLLFGDSRIAEWGTPPLPGWNVVNRGCSGATTAELRLLLPEALERSRPAAVLLQAGINDLKLAGVRPDLKGAVVSTCVSNLVEMVNECTRRRMRVIVTPVWPAGPVTLARRVVWNSSVAVAIEETNLRLEQVLGRREDVLVTNVFAILRRGGVGIDFEQVYRDTLHLKPEAYSTLSTALPGCVAWEAEPSTHRK